MKLLEIRLPEGDVSSFSIGHKQRGQKLWFDPRPALAAGFDGLRIIGNGNRILPPQGKNADGELVYQDTTGLVDHTAGFVQFENVRVHCGGRMAVMLGPESAGTAEKRPTRTKWLGCEFLDRPDFSGGKWLVQNYQGETDFEDCRFAGHAITEHDHYGHSVVRHSFIRCVFVAAGMENLKETGRPFFSFYPPGMAPKKHAFEGAPWYAGATLLVQDCQFLDHSLTGHGGAIVLQGPGLKTVVVERCFMHASSVAPWKPAFAMDNGHEWYSGKTGFAFEEPGCETVLLKHVIGMGSKYKNGEERVQDFMLVRALSFGSMLLEGCGFFGEGGMVRFEGAGTFAVKDCNSEAAAKHAGWDGNRETPLALKGSGTVGTVDRDQVFINGQYQDMNQ